MEETNENKKNTKEEKISYKGYPPLFLDRNPSTELKKLKGQQRKLQHSVDD